MNARMLSLINDSTASEAESPAFGGSAPSAVQTRAMLRARASRTSDHLPAGVVVQPDQQCTRSEDAIGEQEAGQDPALRDAVESPAVKEGAGPRALPTPVRVVPQSGSPSSESSRASI